ncbi:TetR family transcriptional regulator [Desertibaculum subflavum]|uniref:TetR family transcriptional regulator n=1 Tax=Desertibaculum subflavum TaxID=2268458 RepID=UPI000E6622C2
MDKAPSAGRQRAGTRIRSPEATRQDIIDVATREFARNGLSGARVDEIAEKTGSSKRMIYYYFGDKEGLYLAVLEEAYRRVRRTETELDLEHLPPVEALRRLVEFTFDHHHSHEAFIRLVMIENIHHGDYLARSRTIQDLNVSVIGELDRIYQRGLQAGVFRKGLAAIDLHWQISALCFFNVSNRATFSRIFRVDLTSKKALTRLRAQVVEMILRNVLKSPV